MKYLNALFLLGFCASGALAVGPGQATGVKVGEVSSDSAIVWVRLTESSERNWDGTVTTGTPAGEQEPVEDVSGFEGACPGAPGKVRLRYGPAGDPEEAVTTDWVDVVEENDYTHQFRLGGLRPDSVYAYSIITAGTDGEPEGERLRGSFRSAPPPDEPRDVTFTVITGQMYRDLDDPKGFLIYDAMARLNPAFLVATGDTVYYDNEAPRAVTESLARYHWHRMYSLPRLVDFHLRFPAYWMKDDHDTIADDCWPTKDIPMMLPMTFAKGQRIFLEEVPMGDKTWRTYRWGKGLQIWLVEGRDYRSANTMPDGPEKTIWGKEQKQWLKESLLASDADWRILISPTPLVGPDRKRKADNHANAAFAHEGNEFRRWAAENLPNNFFIACGDRHWQYHSVDPETGVQEFSCGPASDQHAGGSPGEDPNYHRFHRVEGGFLEVSVMPREVKSAIVFRLHDVNGKVVYEYKTGTQ